MEREEVKIKLVGIIKPYVQDMEAFGNISETTDLLQDLKINSAHLIDIVLDVEEAFDIEIDDESVEKMITVKDSVDTILACVTAAV
ncbi:MAG: acyl carrier protein [Flavobacteriales bacterium]|nr:acyl carrier protein [Flavobacteriales bacterium]